MKRFMKQFTGITLAVALVISSLAIAPDASAAPKAKKIVMNKKKVSLKVGEKFKLKVKKIKPSKAKKKVTYKVNKKGKSVIKVTKKGVIKALAEGKATVKVRAKSNKKAKAKVKVTVTGTSVVTPTPAPTGEVLGTPTVAPSVAPTGDAGATEAPTPTEKPTRTPKPTATPVKPTATPTPPPMKDPAAPYSLAFSADTVTSQDGASFEITNQGVVISVTEQYGGVAFVVPGNITGNNYDTVTVTYRTPQNVGPGFGCGLWRAGGSSESDKATEDVVAWDGLFTVGNAGTYTATISGQDATNAWYINKALFFFNDTDTLNNGAAQVTITSVTFSHSEYDGPLPTATSEPQKLEAVKLTGTITVDGTADEAWDNIPSVPMDARITCDNAGGSATSANIKLAWDANNLYGYAVVRDSDIDATAENDYQRDGFEFFLDEDNSKETSYDINADAFQYRFTGLTKDSTGAKLPALSSIFAAGSDAARTAYEGIQIDYVYTEKGYAVEFKVPFASAKKTKDVIGFDAIIQDCKNGGRDAEMYLSDATRTMIYYNLTDTFPELELVETATPPTPAPQMPEAIEIAGGITVDGVEDNIWARIAAITMPSRITCDNAGDSDTTAALKLAWDANNLYGFAIVDDSNIDATAETEYQRDGFEIFLDENNSKENSYDTNTDAFQYRLTGLTKNAEGEKLPALSKLFAAGSEGARSAYAGIQMEYEYTDAGYVVEFKIPFTSPKALNTVIGFDAIVQDCKDGGRDAEIYLSKATRTMNYWNLEDTFPTIRLVEKDLAPMPEPTPEPTPTPTEAPATATPEPTEEPATATPEPTETPATATPEPTETPARETVTLDLATTDIVIVNGPEGAAVTVGEDGSISYESEDGFTGFMIPVPEQYVLNIGESFDIIVDYESAEGNARIYLTSGTVDVGRSNTIAAAPSPLTGTLTATADNVNYIFVKSHTYGATFSSLKVNSVTIKASIVRPEGSLNLSSANLNGTNGAAFDIMTGKLSINTAEGNSEVYIPLNEELEAGTTVAITVKGSWSGTTGFRVWLGNGPSNRGENIQVFGDPDLPDGEFEETFEITTSDVCTMLTIKHINSWEANGGPIDGLEIENIIVEIVGING